jgi:hypothetical protein
MIIIILRDDTEFIILGLRYSKRSWFYNVGYSKFLFFIIFSGVFGSLYEQSVFQKAYLIFSMCMCVCVCVCERERERESVCVCLYVEREAIYSYTHR